ncbi:uncharacterized protein F4822DRAFT_274636 [Hypoxylon trugodes]|uniref:uncharacterized protein n=1 Tax=Hypoxylon trugodes TaxID=326681 RepID=UPI0021A075C6|nr:uncharacterized protein F4822DRAFT_274636 [Hypoxylon trugodes]KAI1387128.1 hypothetical protein F4822DRAFT_274636 [Hypoxylon trugodes]
MPGITVASVTAASVRRSSREPRDITASPTPQRLAGSILWLPPKNEIRGNCDPDLEAGMCDHPVVILSPWVDDGKVVYLMMTSFGGRDLGVRFSDNSARRLEYLPIAPAAAHPDNGMLLSLEDSSTELSKKSYVRTKTQHRIARKSLRAYNRYGLEYILSGKSYQDLIEYAKFTPPTSHPGSHAVSPPACIWRHDTVIPVTRERRDSYSEYLSVQRGLESGSRSSTRVHHSHHHTPLPSMASVTPRVSTITWDSSTISERDPLLTSSYGYSRHTQPSIYSHNYSSNRPTYSYRASVQTDYRGPEPLEAYNRSMFWTRLKRLIWFILAIVAAYAAYRGVYWLVGIAQETGSAIKQGVQSIGDKIGGFWSKLVDRVRP